MKNIISKLFPYRLYLHIFQLERYDITRAIPWIFSNFLKRSTQDKKPLIWTGKAKTLTWISVLASLVLFGLMVGTGQWVAACIVFLVVWMQPYTLIILALGILKPYEYLNRGRTIRKTRAKIRSLKKTKIIGIAGSYGKTSVKDILYHLLSKKYKVLKTPLSYNTIFGIAQVVDLELNDSYDFFLCEMGEFQRGDIAEMCEMVAPHYGIMTGINDQHLERFKTIENTTATIFELFDYLVKKDQKTIVNCANPFIVSEVQKRSAGSMIVSYGEEGADVSATNLSFNDKGSRFILCHKSERIAVKTALLGKAHINNILGASALAIELGVSLNEIRDRLENVPLVSHRFEQIQLPNGYLLVDNSYSSNSTSFHESLVILKGLDRKNKILVTPGMVELGSASDAIHEKLGELARGVCSKVILVGTTSRTKSLARGLGDNRFVFMDNIKNLWQEVEKLRLDPIDTVILLENDLPDNY